MSYSLQTCKDTVACQAPLSMGILQARILEWVAMPSSRGSSQCRDRSHISHIAGGFFTIWATREALITISVTANLVEYYSSNSVPNALCVWSHLISIVVLLRRQSGVRIYSRAWVLATWSHAAWIHGVIPFPLTMWPWKAAQLLTCVSVSPSIKWE